MASFPALQPSTRAWTPGNFGASAIQSLSGAQVRITYGSERFGDVLQMTFANRTEEDSYLIATHYNGQGGSRDSFSLPAAVFAGLDSFGAITGTNRWIYRRAPGIEHNSPDVHTISVELERVLQ